MSSLLKIAEKIFVVLTLFLSTTALIPVLVEKEDVGIISDPYSPILFMGVYLITGILVWRRQQTFIFFAQKNIWIWLLVGVALASIFWTVAPDITPRRSFLLLGTTVFGVYLAMRYSLREQLELLGWAFSLVIILSFIFAIALPKYGVMTFQEDGIHSGAWRGIMSHKNILGRTMVLSSLVFFFLAISKLISHPKYRWFAWGGYILSLVLILLSTSKSALIISICTTLTIPLYRTWRSNYTRLIPTAILGVLVIGSGAILLLDNLPIVASAIGRDLTLTGRTDIWNLMLDLIQQRPLFGYGFNAFWRDWNSEVTAYLWRNLEWECPYGHNGFMDLLAELGISGLGLFIISYITTYIRSIRYLRVTKYSESIFPLIYLTFLLTYNITESTLVTTNSIFWILYVSMIFSVAFEYEQAKNFQLIGENLTVMDIENSQA